MKESRYNHILYVDGYGYWYNALTKSYFKLTQNTSQKLSTLINDSSKIKENAPNFYDKLVAGGFILPKEIDEIDIIRKKHYEAVHKKNYFLVVLPTLNCNFKCWYCIQDHVPSVMPSKVIEAIKRHIEHMIRDKKIEALHLDWFGGEPFMFFDRIIRPISEFAIAKCKEYGIPFINGATTNGYFINEEVSKHLEELKFVQFQITLDGNRKNHDKVKYMKGCSSAFDHVLTNINSFLSRNPNVRVFLRINYTHDTLSKEIVDEVNKFICETNRDRVTITPKKVWQEKVDKDFSEMVIELLDAFSKSGYKVQRYDICNTFTPCYVNQEYYNAINYNGNVVKCTACDDLYNEQPRGILLENGEIQWNDNYDIRCMEATFENERCLNCKKLPICMGLCPREHMKGETYCKYDVIDNDYDKNLRNFLINEYVNN